MLSEVELSAIAKDIEACGLMLAIGNNSAKAKAQKHLKACKAALKADFDAREYSKMSDDDLLAELGL
jgi:hypothetical protein